MTQMSSYNNPNHTNTNSQERDILRERERERNKPQSLNTKAFSLIELSLVLIIVGILVMGAIKGYSLIAASKIISLSKELEQYSVATETFQAKYGFLPGIMPNPKIKLGNKAKSHLDDNRTNDYIINESGEVTNAESINFFNHLSLAGLLDGEEGYYIGTDNDLDNRNSITKKSKYYPTTKAAANSFIYVRGDDVGGNYNKISRLAIGNYGSGNTGLDASLLLGLDRKIDDGLPLSGLISIVPTALDDSNTNTNTNTNNTNSDINNTSGSIININFSLINETYAASYVSCLTQDRDRNEIQYNIKGKDCILLKSIDVTKHNKVKEETLNNIVGEPCLLTELDNYANAESIAGIKLMNNSTKRVNCNNGYRGDITVTCREGQKILGGEDNNCVFVGCKKFDENIGDTINSSLNDILYNNNISPEDESYLDWDNSIEENARDRIVNNNRNTIYQKGDIIDTLGCRERIGHSLLGGSGGYGLKCEGNDVIAVQYRGGCNYIETCTISSLTENSGLVSNTIANWAVSDDTGSTTGTTYSPDSTDTVNYGTYVKLNTCATGYSKSDDDLIYQCTGVNTWTVVDGKSNGFCGVPITYYSPRLYDDVNKSGTAGTTKVFKIGDSVNCHYNNFDISDPDSGTVKACGINGYRYYYDGQTFTVQTPDNYTAHQFCHGSYIPRDLNQGLTGNASVDGWCSDFITRDTYKTTNTGLNGTFTYNKHSSGNNSGTQSVLTCSFGKYKISSGKFYTQYVGQNSFCTHYGIAYSLKEQNKSVTFNVYGAKGGGSNGGYGGYTKGVMSSDNLLSTTFYIVIGRNGDEDSGGYNGGGNGYYGGGGATHIATANGVLSNLSGNKGAVLLVAGGGGGKGYSSSSNKGGAGGGANQNGGDGGGNREGGGGTLSYGGDGYYDGYFGQGGKGKNSSLYGGGGGGGGYYGGGGGGSSSYSGGGGGGSGFCDTNKFTCSGTTGGSTGYGSVTISW